MMRKTSRVLTLMAALTLFFVDYPFGKSKVYKWVDETGTIHFSGDESNIPGEYKGQVEKKSVLKEPKPQKDEKKTSKQDEKRKKGGPIADTEKKRTNVNKIEGDVIESIKTILALWKDGKYDALYDYGDLKSRMAVNKEDFEQRMAKKGIRLASSWETIRDIQVDVKSTTLAYATVRIGYKPTRGGDTKFRTEIYRMDFENGMWKINLMKILSARI